MENYKVDFCDEANEIIKELTKKEVKLIKEKQELLEALKSADTFIKNGREYGYIQFPEEPDVACKTMKLINDTLKKYEEGENE